MKTTKKLFSLLLAVMLIMALGVTAFAAGNDGKIIISNPQSGATYTAYKVFDLTYDENGNHSYTASAAVKDLLGGNVEGLSFTLNDLGTYNVEQTANFSAAALAKYIKENVEDLTVFGTGTAFVTDGTTAVADNLARGYYFVTSSAGTVCELTNAKTVTIKDKNETPEIEKTVDDTDKTVEVGQKLTYNIKGTVPSTLGYTEYTYEVSDTMTEGLTFNNDVKVIINGNDVTANVDVVNNNNNGFTVTIDITKYRNDVDKDVKITYTATVNESAIDRNFETNSATLKYSNDPTDSTKTGTSDTKVDVYTFNIVVDKYKSGSTETKLANAKFVLKNSDGNFYKYDTANNTVSWVNTKNAATEVVTDENGAANFKGIQAGTYKLEETAAPDGFNPLTSDVVIVITSKDSATVAGEASNPVAANLSVTASVANSTGTVLPETGGIGTMIFIIAGAIAVIGAGIFLVTNKRMSKESI